MTETLNKLWIGFVIGIILPIISLGIFYKISSKTLGFAEFLMMIRKYDILTQSLTICVLPGFLVFFFFYWKQINRAAQGVVLATLLLTIGLVIVNL